jgi:hypothetical protein
MAVHNGGHFLHEAIESILGQTFKDFEFVIINDGSTDGSRDVILNYDDPRIRLVENQENIGLTKSLNRGLASARGEFVARLDADDLSHPTRLEKQVSFLERNPDCALVGTQARLIDAEGNLLRGNSGLRAQSDVAIEWHLLFGNPFVHSSVMFRLQIIWDRLGGYDETYRFNQDFELWSRLLVHFRASNIPEALIDYRSHAASIVGARGEDVLESRRHNLLMNKAVQRENVRRVLGSEALAKRWPDVWIAVTVSWLDGNAGNAAEVVDYIGLLHKEFVRRFPQAGQNAEIRLHLAETLCYVACHLASRRRLLALKAYAWSIREHPGPAFREAIRFWLLFVGGESFFGMARQIRRILTRRPLTFSGEHKRDK